MSSFDFGFHLGPLHLTVSLSDDAAEDLEREYVPAAQVERADKHIGFRAQR